MKLEQARRGMSCAALVAVSIALSACSSAPKKGDPAAQQALQEKVDERIAAADKAQKAGNADQAMEQLDQAIKADPSSKAPWLKKAQMHFDARQYGPAITAAQEALQRDVNDLTAKSILAVSGLRVSAQALEQLRKTNEVTGSARSEAESVAKIIREALGEPILVPVAEPASGKKPAPRAASPARLAQTIQASPTAAGNATPPKPAVPLPKPAVSQGAATKPAAPANGGRSNPFGALQ